MCCGFPYPTTWFAQHCRGRREGHFNLPLTSADAIAPTCAATCLSSLSTDTANVEERCAHCNTQAPAFSIPVGFRHRWPWLRTAYAARHSKPPRRFYSRAAPRHLLTAGDSTSTHRRQGCTRDTGKTTSRFCRRCVNRRFRACNASVVGERWLAFCWCARGGSI